MLPQLPIETEHNIKRVHVSNVNLIIVLTHRAKTADRNILCGTTTINFPLETAERTCWATPAGDNFVTIVSGNKELNLAGIRPVSIAHGHTQVTFTPLFPVR